MSRRLKENIKTVCAIDTEGSCSRRSTLSTKTVPLILQPFEIHALYKHISRVFIIDPIFPESIQIINKSYLYIHEFLEYFIFVKNCIK
jgi:hypothetical protein